MGPGHELDDKINFRQKKASTKTKPGSSHKEVKINPLELELRI